MALPNPIEHMSEPHKPLGATPKVLVVDDSRLQLRILSSMLTKWGFEVLEAESAEDALAICHETLPDLVISDWMMPGMTGLDLCRAFRDIPKSGYGYFILLTSKGEKGDITQGLDAGADDFLTKPVNSGELRSRLNAGMRIISMERELSEQHRLVTETLTELRQIHDGIENDLKQARRIQQSLVPERSQCFGTSRVSLLLKPLGHVGGDLVGMFSPRGDMLGLYCIDVSGHGITSAMVTARVAGYLSSKFPEQNVALEKRSDGYFAMRGPDETAELLNHRLCADPGADEYLTLAYCAVDLQRGFVKFVQAGHPPPLLIRANGEHEFVGVGGLPIGLIDDARYESTHVKLEKGDRLLLYSDGFTEAVGTDGTMLDEDGFSKLVASVPSDVNGEEFLQDLFWKLASRSEQDDGLSDDVSAVLFEYDCVDT